MKKLLVLMMCIVCVLSMTVTTYAETNQTVISLTIDPTAESYTVNIPPTCVIDPATKTQTLKVTLEDVHLVWSDTVVVSVTSQNIDEDGDWGAFLVHESDSSKKIHYILENEDNSRICKRDRSIPVIGYYKGEYNLYGTLDIEVDGDYPGAGTYTDTLTFSVEVFSQG